MALAAPISTNYTEGARLLLEAGADPNRYADDSAPPSPAVYAAVRAGCSAELTGLLLAHGADPGTPGPDGRSPYALATVQGRADLATLLRRYGVADDIADTDRFLAACQHADQAAVEQQLTQDPGLPGRLTAAQQAAAMIHAAETGNTPAVALMLDLGFPVDARGGDGAATANPHGTMAVVIDLAAAAQPVSLSTRRRSAGRTGRRSARPGRWTRPGRARRRCRSSGAAAGNRTW